MTKPRFFETPVFTRPHGVTSQKTWIFNKTAVRTSNPIANVCQPTAQLSIAVSSRAAGGLPNPSSIARNDFSSLHAQLLTVGDRNVLVFVDYTVLSSSFIVMIYHIWDLSSSVIMWHRVTGLCHLSDLEDVTAMLTGSVWHQLPSDAVSYPKRTDTSTVLLRCPLNSDTTHLRRLALFCRICDWCKHFTCTLQEPMSPTLWVTLRLRCARHGIVIVSTCLCVFSPPQEILSELWYLYYVMKRLLPRILLTWRRCKPYFGSPDFVWCQLGVGNYSDAPANEDNSFRYHIR